MPLLVTSASGASGNGFGALLAFESDGSLRGTFVDDDRIADPRGLAVHPQENLLFLNSGADRVVAISVDGQVVRDTGRIEGLNPGGGNFGPDGRYFVGLRSKRTIIAFSTSLDAPGEHLLPPGVVPFPRGFAFGHDGRLFLASGMGPDGQGDALQLFPCVGQAEKDLAVQAFTPKPAVEALDITVLHGTARPDEVEFSPAPDVLRCPDEREAFRQ